MHRDEYVARLRSQRQKFSGMLGKYREDSRIQADQLKVQAELRQLIADPDADKLEIQRCKNWLNRHGPSPSYKPVQLTSRQRRVKTLMGSLFGIKQKGKKSFWQRYIGDV